MGKGNKQNFARKRKRKGHGNQYTKQHCKYKKAYEKDCTNSNHNKSSNIGDCMPCTSAKKMKLQGNLQDNVKGNDNYFLFVNFSVLQDIFEEVSKCPDCDEWLTLSDNGNGNDS